MQSGASSYVIKEGQNKFVFKLGLPQPEDYGVSTLASWDTTVWIAEKTANGFTLKFGTSCPKEGGVLYLTLYTPMKPIILQETRASGTPHKERIKLSKKTQRDVAIT
jgi:hypothetical protein